MRIVPALLLCAALLAPGVSLAASECEGFTRNIAHYEQMAERAEQLDNPMWEKKTRQHIALLEKERAARCPEWSPEAQANRAMMQLLKLAGKAALTYFTFGAF